MTGGVDTATILGDCEVQASTLAPVLERLCAFLVRYVPHFSRREQREHATTYVEGLLSDLERKSIEPIATRNEQYRRPLQHFVGAGRWTDERLQDELRRHVTEEIGDPRGVLAIDGSSFPKHGGDSVGVKRQWCGRLGKRENCQVGVYLGYATPKGHALVGHRLYLPEEWCDDPERRARCHVPETVEFMKAWEIAAAMIEVEGAELPHAWVVADDELGRVGELRELLRERGEHYVVDVPCVTMVRVVSTRGEGATLERADAWAKRLPPSAWTHVHVRDGEKGPIVIDATMTKVRTNLGGQPGPVEMLLVIRTTGSTPEISFHLAHAPEAVSIEELVRAKAERHRIEEDFERGKGEVGLGHYELRSWVGWHHHQTLALIALFFLVAEHRRLGGKYTGNNPSSDGCRSGGAAA